MLGEAQIIVLIVLSQRTVEALYAAYNTRQLVAQGAQEAGREFFPVIIAGHIAWLAAIFLIVPPETEFSWPLLVLYILLQFGRYWLIFLMGRFWTLRIIVPQTPHLVTSGPYRYFAHPYVTVVMLEIFLLPLVFDAWEISVVMTAVIGAIRYYQIVLEEETLEARRVPAEQAPAPQ